MSKVYCDITVSVDWYVAGSNQVEQVAAAGAFAMGRNMFGPIRAEWDLDWNELPDRRLGVDVVKP
jgi:hypothetical protein